MFMEAAISHCNDDDLLKRTFTTGNEIDMHDGYQWYNAIYWAIIKLSNLIHSIFLRTYSEINRLRNDFGWILNAYCKLHRHSYECKLIACFILKSSYYKFQYN